MERKVEIAVIEIFDGDCYVYEAVIGENGRKKTVSGKSREEVFEKIVRNIPINKKYVGGKPEFPPEYY